MGVVRAYGRLIASREPKLSTESILEPFSPRCSPVAILPIVSRDRCAILKNRPASPIVEESDLGVREPGGEQRRRKSELSTYYT
jgi:hypothetical protein